MNNIDSSDDKPSASTGGAEQKPNFQKTKLVEAIDGVLGKRKLYVLDTNVLMHDPACLFKFKEHDIFIPMIVLEELDANKKGLTEQSQNARQASRFIDELIEGCAAVSMRDGIPIRGSQGKLMFQTGSATPEDGSALQDLPGNKNDNGILSVVLSLHQKKNGHSEVIFVSKDINARIKAAILEVKAEDYRSDQTLEDIDLLYSGAMALPADFWDEHGATMKSWQEKERTFYELNDPIVAEWYPNQFLYVEDESGLELIVRSRDGQVAVLERAKDYRTKKNNVWGITARNREQNFALNVLLDPDIDFVTLLGTAGTGKTLLALAAALVQVLDKKLYSEIIMTRETVPVGEDIGFLPGTEEEKMAPWMGALIDNLELLGQNAEHGEWEKNTTSNIIMNRVKIRSLNFMRGRTFLNRYLIIDEAQNLTSKQMKTLITRAGPGTKIICIGNLSQIDTPYLTATTSGLTYVVDRFKDWQHGAHIILERGERSRLADYANDNL